MNETIILNNGTKLKGHLLESGDRLFLYIYEKTLKEVFDLLIVKANTNVIRYERNGETGEVTGYVELMSVSVEWNNMISASMKK